MIIPAALVNRGDVVAGLCDLAVCMASAAEHEQHPARWASLWLQVRLQHPSYLLTSLSSALYHWALLLKTCSGHWNAS